MDRYLARRWPFAHLPTEHVNQALLLLRFGIIGVLNTLFGYGVFALLILLGVWPDVALSLSTLAGVTFNFQTSRHLVFRSKGQVLHFVAIYVFLLFLDWTALRLGLSQGANALLVQAVLVLPIALISFLCQKFFVFYASHRSS